MKKSHIQICDSRRVKGQFFVRIVSGSGEKLSASETFESVQAVNKNLVAHAAIFLLMKPTIQGLFDTLKIKDTTKGKYWERKYQGGK